jgi:hypothetical protein
MSDVSCNIGHDRCPASFACLHAMSALISLACICTQTQHGTLNYLYHLAQISRQGSCLIRSLAAVWQLLWMEGICCGWKAFAVEAEGPMKHDGTVHAYTGGSKGCPSI